VSAAAAQSVRRALRAGVLLGAALALLASARRRGALAALRGALEPEALRAAFDAAGPVGGVALYLAAFCAAELLHLPGALFVAVGVLVWGCAS